MNSSRRHERIPTIETRQADGGVSYPVVTVGKRCLVPVRELASHLGCTRRSILQAALQLPAHSRVASCEYTNAAGRKFNSPAVDESVLDYLAYSWRGSRGAFAIHAMKRSARMLALAALGRIGPNCDEAVVRGAVLQYQLEIERQMVGDRDRQIAALKLEIERQAATLKQTSNLGRALVNERWTKAGRTFASEEVFLEADRLRLEGLQVEEIASKLSVAIPVLIQFFRGKYNTVAARAAMATLAARGKSESRNG